MNKSMQRKSDNRRNSRYSTWEFCATTLLILLMICSLSYLPPTPVGAAYIADPKITGQPESGTYEINTASVYLWVSVEEPTEPGVTLAFQWYSATKNDMTLMRAIYSDDDPTYGLQQHFIVPQELGTTYYWVMVQKMQDGEPVAGHVYSDPAAKVTFVPAKIRDVNIVGIAAPVKGAKPQTTARHEGTDPMHPEARYDIVKVVWEPNHSTFQPATAYTVKISLKAKSENEFDRNALVNPKILGKKATNRKP